MNKFLIGCIAVYKLPVVIITLNLLVVACFLHLQSYQYAFSQTGNEQGLLSNANNMTIPDLSGSNENLQSLQSSSGFVANGKINTVIDVPNGKWLAAGNWSIIVNNGNVTSFDTKMTWYNSTGTNAHTHDLTNFKSVSGNTQAVPMNLTDKQKTIEGFTDVGSNGRTSWFEVPTVITINDGKIISISVDDNKTNGHFAGQPLLGIVDSFVQCSDVPGPNMELLPPCSPNTEEANPFMMNDTSAFPPPSQFMPEGTFPTEDPSQGFPGPSQGFPTEDPSQGFPGPSQGFPTEDPSQGFPTEDPSQGFPTEDPSQGFPGPSQGFPTEDFFQEGASQEQTQSEDDDQTGEQSSFDNQTETDTINSNCTELEIENVTASGFESDPSDYHPPADAIDDELSTWWSNNGNDPWIEISLVEPNPVCGVAVTWNKGDERDYSFEIGISEDGTNFEKVFEGANDNESTEEEIYAFDQVNGKYLRLTITDTSSNDGWTSIQEIDALGIN
jgi:F5/8 type C domain